MRNNYHTFSTVRVLKGTVNIMRTFFTKSRITECRPQRGESDGLRASSPENNPASHDTLSHTTLPYRLIKPNNFTPLPISGTRGPVILSWKIFGAWINARWFLRQKLMFISKARYIIFYSKHCPSEATTFFHLSGNTRIPRLDKFRFFLGDPVTASHLLISSKDLKFRKAMLRWPKQMVIWRGNVW